MPETTINEEVIRIENAKQAIKTSIENKGVTVSEVTRIDGYSALIDQIDTRPTLVGTASEGDVLTGKTFYSNSYELRTGVMPNRGAVSQSVGYGGSYTVPAGYHNGNGTVTNSIGAGTIDVTDLTITPNALSGTWDSTNSRYVVSQASKTADMQSTVTTAGYVSSTVGTKNKGTATVSAPSNLNISQAVISGSVSNATATVTVAPGNVTIANNTSTISGKARIDVTPQTSTTISTGHYIAIKATAAANTTGTTASISGSGTASTSTSGYAQAGTTTGSISVSGTATGKTSAKDSSVYYVPIADGTVSVDGGELSKGTASGGGLSGGGLSGGGLSLGTATAPTITLSEVASASQDTNIDISKTDIGSKDTTNYPYYFKISGTSSGGGNTVTRAKVTRAKVDRAAFSQDVSRAGVNLTTTAGWIEDTVAETAVIPSESTTVSLAAGSLASGELASDSKTATAANGSTTSYVKLKKASLSASGSISVSGSGTVTPGDVTISESTAEIPSGKTYINLQPVTDSSQIDKYFAEICADVAQGSATNISASGSGTITATVTGEGYVKTTDSGSATLSASGNVSVKSSSKSSSTYFLPIPSGIEGTPTASKGTVSSNQVTVTPSVTNSNGWIEGGTKTGTGVVVKASELVSGNLQITSQGSSSSPVNVTNYAGAYVRSASSYSLAITDKGSTDITVGTLSSGYYPLTASLTGTLSASTAGWFSSGSATDSSVTVGRIIASTITNNTTLPSGSSSSGTINRGSYIKIGTGYNASDKYYKAQTNSGTKTITGSGTTSVDGYANASVTAGSATPSATLTEKDSLTAEGTLVSKKYFTVTPTASVGTPGWISSISDGSVVEYEVKSGSVSRDGNTVSWTTGWVDADSSSGATTTASRSGNTVSWGTGWITEGSSSGATTSRSASTGSLVAKSGVTIGDYLTTTATGNYGGFYGYGAVSTGTGWITSGSTNSNASSTYYIKAGSATTPTASGASTSTSLSGTTLTVARSVTPTVSAGWVTSGTAGTVTITGTVPTETKSASGSGDITPSSGKLLSKVTVGAGSATPSATVTGSATALSSTTAMNNQYFSVTPKASVGTAGWISSISNGGAVNYKVKDGSATPNATVTAKDSITAEGTIIDKKYFTVTPKASVGTAGWISSISDGSIDEYEVKSGSATTPATTITANPSLSTTYTSDSGYKMSVSTSQNVTPSVSAGWIASGTAGTITVSGSAYVAQSTWGTTSDSATYTSLAKGTKYKLSAGYYPSARYYQTQSDPTLSGTATEAQVLDGATFYSNSYSKKTGTMTNRGAVSASVGYGESYTVPSGYHNGSGTVSNSIGAGTITASGSKTQSTPSFSVSGNVITASVAATSGTATPSVSTAGYVSSSVGTKTDGTFTMSASSNTYTITALTNSTYAGYLTSSTTARSSTVKTISGPTTADIYIYPSTSINTYWANTYGIKISKPSAGSVSASATSELYGHNLVVYPSATKTAGYISAGSVSGDSLNFNPDDLGLTERNSLSKSGGTVSIAANSWVADDALSTTVTLADLGYTTKAAQTYTPTTTDQTIASGYALTGAQTIKGSSNLVAGNIKKDVTIFGVTGTYQGLVPSGTYQLTGVSIDDPVDVTSYAYAKIKNNASITVQNGYGLTINVSEGSVTLNFIAGTVNATNLSAANIKKGVSILGTTGSYNPIDTLAGMSAGTFNHSSSTGYTYIAVKSPVACTYKFRCNYSSSYYTTGSLSANVMKNLGTNGRAYVTNTSYGAQLVLEGSFTTSNTIYLYAETNNTSTATTYSHSFTPSAACKTIIITFAYNPSSTGYWNIVRAFYNY